jgi:hypothetical protein
MPKASMKIVDLASKGAADLVKLETRILGGRTDRQDVRGVLGEKQCPARLGRQRRAWSEELEVDRVREKFDLFPFVPNFRD